MRKDIEHMPAIDIKRYEAVRAKVKSVEQRVEKKESVVEKRNLDQWRGGKVRLADIFTKSANEEKEDGKGGRESFGGPKVKGPDQDKDQEQAKRRRQNRDHDSGR